MNIIVNIDPQAFTKDGFAVVHLKQKGGKQVIGQLDVEFSKLSLLPNDNPQALDFLLLAATAYALDKLIPRSAAPDNWTRDFSLTLPVSAPELWTNAHGDLARCLSFLTGDSWAIEFVPLHAPLTRPPPARRQRSHITPPQGDAVCLFSGGLDSLIGAIDHLESHRNKKLLLVGHHDGQMAGPLSDQRSILEQLRPFYLNRIHSLLARVGHTGSAQEITLRSRSLLFVALGIYAASSFQPDMPLLLPENGTIALNVPLTPSRRGSCSTRTAHPYYLITLQRALAAVKLRNPIVTPLEFKTKGEAVSQCLNQNVLRKLAPLSVSCAKRGHKRSWPNRGAKSCGRCMPCIYRRAALHTIGMDNETYGADICTGEVDTSERDKEAPNDLRACFSFLKRNPSPREIAAMLLASGSLDPSLLSDYANLVCRAMDEIRSLLRDKAIPEVRQQAGILF